jgi:hypothetical protein
MQHAVFRAIMAVGVQIGGKEAFLGHDVGQPLRGAESRCIRRRFYTPASLILKV